MICSHIFYFFFTEAVKFQEKMQHLCLESFTFTTLFMPPLDWFILRSTFLPVHQLNKLGN